MLEATSASLFPSSKDVIGSAPIKIRARLDTSTAEFAEVLVTAM
jgi:hypothetical protein